MKNQLPICLIIIFFCINAAKAQHTFEKTYGSSASEKAKSVRQTPDGGYIIGGTQLLKIDSTGVEEWSKPHASSFANPTSDQKYILINNSGSRAIIFTKVALNGDLLWQTSYREGRWANEGNYIEQVKDGGYIVAGRFQSVTGSGMLLLKLDSLGNNKWKKTFIEPTSSAFCSGFAAHQTDDNGYIIAGYAYIDQSKPARHKDVFIVKTDSVGNEEWRKYFGGAMDDAASFVKQDRAGNYFIAGTTKSYGPGTEANMYLMKLNSAGDSLWTQTYGGMLEETATGLWPTNDGGCIVVGNSNSVTSGDSDGYAVKTDKDGNVLWSKNYGGTGEEMFNSVQQTADDGYVMAGYTNSIGAGDFDMFVLKTDSLGDVQLVSGIDDNLVSIVKSDVYPNPSHGVFSVKSELKISGIKFFNVLGELIYSASINANATTLDLSQQSKGIYFYKIYTGDEELLKSGKIVFE